jgi:hypothetical protein
MPALVRWMPMRAMTTPLRMGGNTRFSALRCGKAVRVRVRYAAAKSTCRANVELLARQRQGNDALDGQEGDEDGGEGCEQQGAQQVTIRLLERLALLFMRQTCNGSGLKVLARFTEWESQDGELARS